MGTSRFYLSKLRNNLTYQDEHMTTDFPSPDLPTDL